MGPSPEATAPFFPSQPPRPNLAVPSALKVRPWRSRSRSRRSALGGIRRAGARRRRVALFFVSPQATWAACAGARGASCPCAQGISGKVFFIFPLDFSTLIFGPKMRVAKKPSKKCNFSPIPGHFLSKSAKKRTEARIFEIAPFQANSFDIKDLTPSPKNQVSKIAPFRTVTTPLLSPHTAISTIRRHSLPLLVGQDQRFPRRMSPHLPHSYLINSYP